VIADLITTLGVTDHPVMRDLEARKQVGLERYGTLLYPDNGRDSVLDAYQEALDLCVYLKQAQCEGKGLESAYRTALLLACDLRESLR
jgi:hypothetical protein